MTELITIAELIGKGSFYIPKYQRGYRWTQDEVEKLLNDIYEFNADGTEANEYYCLQPIVVKIKEGEYWIVDGQQRITTISLILDFISEKLSQNESKITINYEVTDKALALDEHYKDGAKTVIKNWNSKKEKECKEFKLNKLKENLLNSTKVIWYELDENENEHKVFERLNVGKIPLTSAELIKAALLNSKNFTRDSELSKIQLALQWDEVEHTLQDDAFWCFLSNDTDKTSTRIDRIFELYYAETDSGRNIFEIFREKSGGGYQKEWNKIYNFFRRNVDLFNDPQAQGLTGFVYYYTESPAEIKEIFFVNNELRNKKDIIEKLKENCRKRIKGEDIEKYIEELRYGDHNKEIKEILLLANIGKATFDGNKFPFDKYKARKDNDEYGKINYDIEHISSQTENDLSNEKERFIYLLSLLVACSNEIKRNNELDIESLEKKYKDDKIDAWAWKHLSELYKGYNIIKPEDADIKTSDLKKIKDILINYDIEHISSQTENDLSNEKEKFIYLLSLLVAYSNEINRNNELEIESLKKKYDDDKIDAWAWKHLSELYKGYNIIKPEDADIKTSDLKKIKDILNKNDICKKYIDDDDIDTDAIGNLVLLDSKTNRSYKNKVFVLKKDCIFKSKNFIPPLTMCAFMRVRVPDKNSKNVEILSYVSQDVKWNKSDCELNKNNIINSIKNLLSDGKSK